MRAVADIRHYLVVTKIKLKVNLNSPAGPTHYAPNVVVTFLLLWRKPNRDAFETFGSPSNTPIKKVHGDLPVEAQVIGRLIPPLSALRGSVCGRSCFPSTDILSSPSTRP